MGDSSRQEATETCTSLLNTFNPCYYFEVVAQAFLKCLGLDGHKQTLQDETSTSQDDSPTTTTTITTEEANITALITRRGRRNPPKPGVSTGQDPQNN